MTGESYSIADLPDKTILQNTRQISGPNDTVSYKYLLPSGRELTATPMRKDQLTAQVLIQWCETVREQAMADAMDERNRLRQEAVEKKAREKRDATGFLVAPDGSQLLASPSVPVMIPSPVAPPVNAIVSPDAFINQQLAASREALERLEWEVQRAMQDYAAAKANLQKWEALAASLTPTAVPTAAPAAVPTKKKRGRPKKVSEPMNIPTGDENV